MPLEKEKPGDDSVGVKQYIDKQFEWQKRVDKLNAYLSGTEAKLRELSISGETKLLQSQILMMKENATLARENLEAWKAVNNEWKDQSKEKEKMFSTKNETEKDVHSLQQSIFGLGAEIKTLAKASDEARGRDKIVTILVSLVCSLLVGFILSYLNSKK